MPSGSRPPRTYKMRAVITRPPCARPKPTLFQRLFGILESPWTGFLPGLSSSWTNSAADAASRSVYEQGDQ